MGKPLHKSKRDAIKTRLEEGLPHDVISLEMNVSIQTVKNYSANLKAFDTVILPSTSQRGRKPILTREMVEVRIPKAQSEHTFLAMLFKQS
jgi:transposase